MEVSFRSPIPPSSHSIGHGVHHRGEDAAAYPSASTPPGDRCGGGSRGDGSENGV